ncbi:response regulator [Gymnodinialimonas hymeniacidonis]|uniref:response regulator n=1 Tax=Gymnodinialimonas hymeniacidonis TaxID=3126508 RepID=UPI0034C6D43B
MANVLVMEDDALQRSHVTSILEQDGHDVASYSNATDAVSAAMAERFDLIITDIIVQVEGRSQPDGGISLIGKVRRFMGGDATSANVPIIAVTGTYKNPGMADILTTARAIGATDELKKPINEADLLSMVSSMLDPKAQAPCSS